MSEHVTEHKEGVVVGHVLSVDMLVPWKCEKFTLLYVQPLKKEPRRNDV